MKKNAVLFACILLITIFLFGCTTNEEVMETSKPISDESQVPVSEIKPTVLPVAETEIPVVVTEVPVDIEYRQITSVTNIKFISMITGPDSENNTESRWKVSGTDIGVLFGEETIYMAFGDTFYSGSSEASFDQLWRSNVLAVISDDVPEDGFTIDSMITDSEGYAKQFIPGVKNGEEEGLYGGFQVTAIPTGGIEIDGNLYVSYMSVSWWGAPGIWTCNFGGIVKSEDKGETFTIIEDLRWPGDSNFIQLSMVRSGDYVYMYGIPAGRFGSVKLMRVRVDMIEDPEKYEYFVSFDDQGSPVYKPGEKGRKEAKVVASPSVGEHSVVYNEYINGYIMSYYNPKTDAIEVRSSENLEGPFSTPIEAITSEMLPTLYGAFMHERLVADEGKRIYMAVSQFFPIYNVVWMELELVID